MRFFLVSLVVFLFCGCTNFQGAKALEFFSSVDKSGRWKTYNRADTEGRALIGDVACLETNLYVLDSASGSMELKGCAKKCWDNFGILIEHVVKDSGFTAELDADGVLHVTPGDQKYRIYYRSEGAGVEVRFAEQEDTSTEDFSRRDMVKLDRVPSWWVEDDVPGWKILLEEGK